MNDGAQEKQARPIFRFLAGVVSVLVYALILIYCFLLYNLISDDIHISAPFFIIGFILILSLPLAISFSFLSIKGTIPKRISNFAFGRKYVPGKKVFK